MWNWAGSNALCRSKNTISTALPVSRIDVRHSLNWDSNRLVKHAWSSKQKAVPIGAHYVSQGRIQDFYNGVSISKKLQEYNNLELALINCWHVNFTGLYAEVEDMYLCVLQTGVQSILSLLILRGCGACPSRKFLKIRCQKSESGGISATKITCTLSGY